MNGASPLQNLLPGYKFVPATDNSPAYAVFDQPIQNSLNDDREYRYVASLAAGVARHPWRADDCMQVADQVEW